MNTLRKIRNISVPTITQIGLGLALLALTYLSFLNHTPIENKYHPIKDSCREVSVLYSPGAFGAGGSLENNEGIKSIASGIESFFTNNDQRVVFYELSREYGLLPPGKRLINGIDDILWGGVDMYLFKMGMPGTTIDASGLANQLYDEGGCVLFFGESNGAAFIQQIFRTKMPQDKFPGVYAITLGAPETYELDKYVVSDDRILYWEHPDDWIASQNTPLSKIFSRFMDNEPNPGHAYRWGGNAGNDCEKPKEQQTDCANFDELPPKIIEFLQSTSLYMH